MGLSVPALAQTPVHISVANLLKLCLVSPHGLRAPAQAPDMEQAVRHMAGSPRGSFVQVAPGLYRLTDANPPMILEMKLRAADGTAHCLAYGAALQPGLGAAAADKFIEFFYRSGQPAPVSGAISRRYTFAGLPFSMELLAYRADGIGEVVGLVMSGVPERRAPTQLAGAEAASTEETQHMIGGATLACIEAVSRYPNSLAPLEAAGLTLERAIGPQGDGGIFFGANNTVKVTARLGSCRIESLAVPVGTTVQLVRNYLNARMPGMFGERGGNRYSCATFFQYGTPLSLNLLNPGMEGQASCSPLGPTQIDFVVAG